MLPSSDAISLCTHSRAIRPGDAASAADWIIRDLAVPHNLAIVLPALLRELIAKEVLRGEVVDCVDPGSGKVEFAAFGLTGFLSNALAIEYLNAPFPHLALELLDGTRRSRGTGAFLDYDQIARANAREGLTLFPLLWLQRSNDPASPETRSLLMASQQSFLRIHRGYRLARILTETTADRAEAFRAGGFRERHRIPAGTPLPLSGGVLKREHVVFEAQRSDFESVLPGSTISYLFFYSPPRCGFTQFERQVLERAANNLTDEEIAEGLRIRPSAVALRWRSIYARIGERVPGLLNTRANHGHASRGKEKRRRVLSFINEHPEELRPYPIR